MRKVLYISGSRADYGPARRVLQVIQSDPTLDLSILATAMHLDPVHGETWHEIEADGFVISERVFGHLSEDSLAAMSASLGLYLYGMSCAVERIQPDIVLVLGDRGEQLAGAMAAAFQNIAVAHLCGGSVSGSIDDSIRHAITKFAHLHLPALDEHARRIIQMGEDPEFVRVVGLPGSDIRVDAIYSRSEICSQFRLDPERPYLLVIQHSVTHSQADARRQITETLEALVSLGIPSLLANPNNDAGGREILATMTEYADQYSFLQILPPLQSRELFASIMAHASVQIGNSSSGILEAMSVELPVVNVGDRQRGREQMPHLLNVQHDRSRIAQAINTALKDEDYRRVVAECFQELAAHDTAAEVAHILGGLDLNVGRNAKVFKDIAH